MYMKRHEGTCTEKRACDDTERMLLASPEKKPQQKPNLLAL